MYSLETREHVDRMFKKLAKNDPGKLDVITRKVSQILENPHHFKPMHFPLQGMRRVHIGSYVLLFSIDEQRKTVVLEDYEHHDSIYRT